MKKLLPFLLLIGAILLLSGCSTQTEIFEAKTYTASSEDIQSIDIDVPDRKIEVSVSSDNQIHLEYSESETESYDLSVSEDHILTIRSQSSKNWTDYIGVKPDVTHRTISLQIPDQLLSSLTIKTTNESISLPALSVKEEIILTNNGGDITFDTLDAAGGLTLEVKNGSITGLVAGKEVDYSITCEIKKGSASLPSQSQGGPRHLSVTANNGDVSIQFQAS